MNTKPEVLEFRNKAAEVATVVTDGRNVRTYEPRRCTSHKTLHAAIAYLEVRNYQIYIGI